MNLTATDRSALIRLASSLPKGSEERKTILAGLKTAQFQTIIGQAVVDWLTRQRDKDFQGIPRLRRLWAGTVDAMDDDGLFSEKVWNLIEEEFSKGFKELHRGTETLMEDLFPEGYYEEGGGVRNAGFESQWRATKGDDAARYELIRQQVQKAADVLMLAHQMALKVPEFDSDGVRKLMLDTQRFYERT